MPKLITTDAGTQLGTAYARKPNLVIKIEWPSGTIYYGYADLTLSATDIQGRILENSEISSQLKVGEIGQVATATITLSDTDGALKTIVNTDVIEGTPATIYHHLDNGTLALADLVPMLSGRIVSEVTWDEGKRTLDFSIESLLRDTEVGCKYRVGDFAQLNPAAVDSPIPVIFGTALKVPALHVRTAPRGTLKTGIGNGTNTFEVVGGERFTQDTTISIRVNGIPYTGIMTGNLFTVVTRNDAIYTNLAIADRPFREEDRDNSTVFWLASNANIAHHYVILNHATRGWLVNFCYKQEGRKCYFVKPWSPNFGKLNILLDSATTISETAIIPRQSWAEQYSQESAGMIMPSEQYPDHDYQLVGIESVNGLYKIAAGRWVTEDITTTDIYAVSCIPTAGILGVYAMLKENGIDTLTPVPSTYYTAHNSLVLGPLTIAAIEFAIPLQFIEGEEWGSTVYVSARSTVGPNVADIIEYIATTYVGVVADPISFATTRSEINSYPANFAYLEAINSIKAIEEISFLSRCGATIRGGYIYLRYLSKEPTTPTILLDSDMEAGTLSTSFTQAIDIYTQTKGTWKSDYSGLPGSEHYATYTDNVATLGIREKVIDVYIYATEQLVIYTVGYWGHIWANMWRTISFKTFLSKLSIDPYDWVLVSVPAFSTNGIRGLTQSVSNLIEDGVIEISVRMSSRSGDSADGEIIESPEPLWEGDPDNVVAVTNPTPPDHTSGEGTVTTRYPEPDPDEPTVPAGTVYPYLKITNVETRVLRGTSFRLTVEIVNVSGERLNTDLVIVGLSLYSSDVADGFSKLTARVTNGYWSGDVTVSGGTGDDVGTLTAMATDHYPATTPAFDIVSSLDTLTIAAYPTTELRGQDFSVGLIAGTPAKELTVELISANPQDRLYDNSGLITTIILDGSGEYSASDWYICGGSELDQFMIVFTDPENDYDDLASPFAMISGSCSSFAESRIIFSDNFYSASRYLDLTVTGVVSASIEFAIAVDIRLSEDGSIDTSYSGPVRLVVEDSAAVIVDWVDAQVVLNNTSVYVTVDIVNGQWSGVATLDVLPAHISPLLMTADDLGGLTDIEVIDITLGNIIIVGGNSDGFDTCQLIGIDSRLDLILRNNGDAPVYLKFVFSENAPAWPVTPYITVGTTVYGPTDIFGPLTPGPNQKVWMHVDSTGMSEGVIYTGQYEITAYRDALATQALNTVTVPALITGGNPNPVAGSVPPHSVALRVYGSGSIIWTGYWRDTGWDDVLPQTYGPCVREIDFDAESPILLTNFIGLGTSRWDKKWPKIDAADLAYPWMTVGFSSGDGGYWYVFIGMARGSAWATKIQEWRKYCGDSPAGIYHRTDAVPGTDYICSNDSSETLQVEEV